MSFAVEIYTDMRKGISLRGVAELMHKIFGIIVSYETIRKWVFVTKKIISRREIVEATCWHADETYIKIKGKGFWLWIVFCADTKQILAWHISKKRLFKDKYC